MTQQDPWHELYFVWDNQMPVVRHKEGFWVIKLPLGREQPQIQIQGVGLVKLLRNGKG
jgi:hypothetical protein